MQTLHTNRPFEDLIVLNKICCDILATDLSKDSLLYCNKEFSNDFHFIYVEGRFRTINTLEDWAAIKSAKLFSEYNYPVICFVNNDNKFLDNNYDIIKNWRIDIRKIKELNSLEEYTNFCINDLYFSLPEDAEKIITIQPDAALVKNGWENYIDSNNFDCLFPHWRHMASIIFKENDNWFRFNANPVNIGNGAMSFRKASIMREISKRFGKMKLAELGRDDFRIPMEDLFFNFFGQNYGYFKKFPTLKDCDLWAKDPYTLEEYKENNCFGMHYPKFRSEWPKCKHE